MNRLNGIAALGPPCAALAATLFLLSGCAATVPRRSHDDASTLSEAVREASKDQDDKHKELHRDPPPEPETTVEVTIGDDRCTPVVDDEPSPAPGPSGFENLHVGLVSSLSNVGQTPFRNAALSGIQIGARPFPQLEWDLAVMGSPMWLTPESGLSAGMIHTADVAVDASIRYFVTPRVAGPALYPIVGARVGSLLWDYRHPIVASGDDPAPIEDDRIGYVAPYAGVGVALIRSARFELGAHVTGGYRIYEESTQQGFRNDLFRDGTFAQVTLETSIRF